MDELEVMKADVTKLHNEVNQLRNHELLINSFAIAMVVVALPALKENILLSIVMLFLLIAIHYWQYTLLDIRTRITTYLTSNNLSLWEENYRKFSNKNHGLSMRKTSALLFIALGLATVVAPFPNFSLSSIRLTSCSSISFFIYFLVILLFGPILFFFNKMLEKIKKRKCWIAISDKFNKKIEEWIGFPECKDECKDECTVVYDSNKNMPAYIRHIITKYTCEWCEIRLNRPQKS